MADGEKKPLAVLALGLGKPPKKSDDDEGADSEYGDDFESAAVDAFPDLKDDPDRLKAFWQAVRACVDRVQDEGEGEGAEGEGDEG